ncbi:glycosyltransferase family 4 protein [Ruoffia sp. FAM 20857]|uniref:glycosyltransferase family 4 protein n=1 Tax=Ruoffia sp. FAM 20857 TaxID=3259515 RepID=UPI003888A431
MKILYIATSFPKPTQGSTIYTDLAEQLSFRKHEITVVATEQGASKTELTRERGIEVLRVATGDYYDVDLIKKGITTLRMPKIIKKNVSKFLSDRNFDFILFESPPVTNSDVVKWAMKKYECPSYLMLKDIFPQNAIDLGILKKWNPLYWYFKLKEKQLLETATIIGCMSEANKNYVLKENSYLDSNKIELFPNTKNMTENYKKTSYNIRRELDIPEDACIFLFGGNMGKPQYIYLLSHALLQLKEQKDIYFLFIGRGTERYKLENTINKHEIINARLLENLPRNEYEQITLESDVGLIVLDPRFTIPNYPSRILSYMEYGKPVLAATDKASDINELISDASCGEWVWSGDKDGFVKKIKQMSENLKLRDIGLNGRKYAEKFLNTDVSVSILENHFNRE